jgi:3',5'-cyclic-AMP phosphodiesterase
MSTPGRSRPGLLVQLSDSHIGARWADVDPASRLAAVVDEVRQLPDRPDAVLMTGDLAENATDAEYELASELFSRLGLPIYVLPGNHDSRGALRRYFELSGPPDAPVQYSVDLGSLRLVVIDSTRPGEDRGELDGDRLAWLDAELKLAPDRLTLLAMHHPPLCTGSPAWDEIGLPAADQHALGEVLRRHSQVRRVVAGHVHQMITADLAGRSVLAIPSTYMQAKLDLRSPEIEFVGEAPAFAVHAVVDGAVISRVRSLSC